MNTDELAAQRLDEVIASPYFETVMSRFFEAFETVILAAAVSTES